MPTADALTVQQSTPARKPCTCGRAAHDGAAGVVCRVAGGFLNGGFALLTVVLRVPAES